MEKPGNGGEFKPTAKNLLIFPTRKIVLNKFTSSTMKSIIASPSNSNFHSIQALFLALVIAVVSSFLTSGSMYAHAILILIKQCLLNVTFSVTKPLDGQTSSKQHFYYPQLSMLFRKLCFSSCLFCFFSHSLFLLLLQTLNFN